MAEKKKYIQYNTPKGIAKWPHLSKSDEGQSEYAAAYRVVLEVEPDIFETYTLSNGETLLNALSEMQEQAEADARKAKKEVNKPPFKLNEETGNYEVSFKLPAEYADKATKTIKENKLIIVDSKLKPFVAPDDGEIGMGSMIRVNFYPFTYNAGGKYGLSLKLKAVQVLDYVPKGGNYGFEVEEDDDTSFNVEDF